LNEKRHQEFRSLILPHNNFGSYLEKKGFNTDPHLEKRTLVLLAKLNFGLNSFATAFPTFAEYSESAESELAEQRLVLKDQHCEMFTSEQANILSRLVLEVLCKTKKFLFQCDCRQIPSTTFACCARKRRNHECLNDRLTTLSTSFHLCLWL